jgi:hypothetical protein
MLYEQTTFPLFFVRYWLKIWINDVLWMILIENLDQWCIVNDIDWKFGSMMYCEWYCKPGGLDSREQSRSRCLDVLRRGFSNCRDFLDSWDVVFELSRPKVSIETPRPMVLSVNLQKAYSKCNIWLFLIKYFPSSDWISSCRQKWLNFFYSNN